VVIPSNNIEIKVKRRCTEHKNQGENKEKEKTENKSGYGEATQKKDCGELVVLKTFEEDLKEKTSE